MQWRILPDIKLHWYSWGDEFSVYHSGSGDTHLIDLTTANVVKELGRCTIAGIGTDELAQIIAATDGVDCDQALIQHIEQMLDSLHQLNIIERVLK